MDVTDRLAALPVFPLPRVVLMPGAHLPLHVFEPRYRALLADVVASDGRMGIGTLVPGYEGDYEGDPPIFPEVGVGRVLQHARLPDGRSNLVLGFEAAGRVVREVDGVGAPGARYRRFSVELIEGESPSDADLGAVRALVLQLATTTPASGEEARRLLELPGEALADAVARRMFAGPELQRAYLASTPAERVRLVCEGLAGLLGAQSPVGEA